MNDIAHHGWIILVVTSLLGCESTAKDADVFENSERLMAETVGDPCVPSDEKSVSWSGLGSSEVLIESSDAYCSGEVCLAHHFQGRVTCPDGYDPNLDDGRRCSTTAGDPVIVAVKPQLEERPASEAVYCSCRCDGPSGQGPYCECPSGYSCEVIETVGLGSHEGSSSYCVKE